MAPEGDVDDQDPLRLEYDAANEALRGLTETRFKLLALVPSLAGAVVAAVSARSSVALLAIGLLGLIATFGVFVYELRNGQDKEALAGRVAELERHLLRGGRPLVGAARGKLFGVVPVTHTLGIALVYGAALGGWSYLVAWGGLLAAGAGHARALGLVLGAVAGAAVVGEVLRLEQDRPRAVERSPVSPPA
jgi:hypothetical protein